MKRILMLAILMAWLAPAPQAMAVGVGRLAFVSGEVWVERGAAREEARAGRRLLRNDVIVTGQRGRAKLVMSDGSRVYVGARSRVEVAEYVHRGGLLSGMFNMFWGKARFFVNKLTSRQSRFQVRTSTAVLGVRGTSFVVNQPVPPRIPPKVPDFNQFARQFPQPTRVVLTTGRVEVRLPTGKVVDLDAGKTLDAHPDGTVIVRPTRQGDADAAPPAQTPPQARGQGQGQQGQRASGPRSSGQGAQSASAPASGGGASGGAPSAPPLAPPPPPPPAPSAGAPGGGVAGGGQLAGSAAGTGTGSGATAGTAVTNAVQNLGVTSDVTIKPQFVLP